MRDAAGGRARCRRCVRGRAGLGRRRRGWRRRRRRWIGLRVAEDTSQGFVADAFAARRARGARARHGSTRSWIGAARAVERARARRAGRAGGDTDRRRPADPRRGRQPVGIADTRTVRVGGAGGVFAPCAPVRRHRDGAGRAVIGWAHDRVGARGCTEPERGEHDRREEDGGGRRAGHASTIRERRCQTGSLRHTMKPTSSPSSGSGTTPYAYQRPNCASWPVKPPGLAAKPAARAAAFGTIVSRSAGVPR